MPLLTPHKRFRNYYHRSKIDLVGWAFGILSFVVGFVFFPLLHGNVVQQGTTSTGASLSCVPLHTRTPKFAYAFLISGCDPTSPLTYRPYLWNILVATKNLRDSGSQADVVLMIQFTTTTTTTTTGKNTSQTPHELPPSDLQWLQLYPIRIHYLPPLLRDNFYSAQLAKFHILELTDYQRVMYLDADVMPLCNLDYILELSLTGHLQPNIVLAWFTEPAHGGLFVLEPGNYDEWNQVVERREQEALALPYPHWDPIRGWGKILTEEWKGLPQSIEELPDGFRRYGEPRHSTNWTFHGDFADQGLLYYWTRFHQKAVSILYLDSIVDYIGDDQPPKHRSSETIFVSNGLTTCLPPGMEYLGHYGSTLHAPLFYDKIPHRDFIHFSGEDKPWTNKRQTFPMGSNEIHSSIDFWYSQLQLIFQDFAKHHPGRKLPTLPLKYKAPILGRYPTHRSMISTIHKKLRKRQQAQEQLLQQQHDATASRTNTLSAVN